MDETLQQAKEQVLRWINEYRDAVLEDYFIYDNRRWDCDKSARTNIVGAITLLSINKNALPPDFAWKDYDNNLVPVTADYLFDMFFALTTFTTNCYQTSWVHKATVEAMTNAEEVLAYNYSTNWPVT